MDLSLSEEQLQLVDSFSALYAHESSSERIRAVEPDGFDHKLWKTLFEAGVLHMAIDEEGGGWDATLLDSALVAEQHGRALGSVPLVEFHVAAALLRDCARAGSDGAHRALAAVLAGEQLVTFAPRSGGHDLELVPGGTVADAVVAFVNGQLVLAELTGKNRITVDNLGSMSLADIRIDAAPVVVADSSVAEGLFDGALDRWLALTAASLVGAGARALEITVDYVSQRRAFGTLIGSFQAISHRLADSATAVDGARLLAQRAACAEVDEPERARELAAMAFAFAYEAARDVTYRGIHFHGGYGFMMEQDVQLYYRRVRGWAGVFGDANVAYDRVAARRYS